jgi:hypothetical protein
MKIAGPIRNETQALQVMNLSQVVHRTEGRGPYLIMQDGCDPQDPRMRSCSFVLTRRGTWLHFYLYLALSESARAQCAQFETAAEAMTAAGALTGQVTVESAESLQEFLREGGFMPTACDLTGNALLEAVRKRHFTEGTPG